MLPRALILHAYGSNRDLDAAQAFELAGAQSDVVALTELRARALRWADYQLLCLPGGFAHADALGAGKLFALDLTTYFADEVTAFVDAGKPVIGMCNGFQALVKSGILPDGRDEFGSAAPTTTLTFNAAGHFECRWITLRPQSETCVWTRGLSEPIYCPVAHGEGNYTVIDESLISDLSSQDQIALVYANADGSPANGEYPHNPNGSIADIAGVCNPAGNVLGLMPHPENHILPHQHPRWTRGEGGQLGLTLFENGVKYASEHA
ncbi:MAG: phosphoribosylformylglycinamidine synthase I [Actinomycetia bacterium]|nr:phosphoribosylformylglycinamidine synthase I [Actinomycetes bacterium]